MGQPFPLKRCEPARPDKDSPSTDVRPSGRQSRPLKEVTRKVKSIVRKALDERFKDEFVFDPIIVQTRFDHDDDEYVDIWIVYDGDRKRLDPHWTAGLSGLILDQVTEDEVPVVPSKQFVEKSEWEEIFEPHYRETGIVR